MISHEVPRREAPRQFTMPRCEKQRMDRTGWILDAPERRSGFIVTRQKSSEPTVATANFRRLTHLLLFGDDNSEASWTLLTLKQIFGNPALRLFTKTPSFGISLKSMPSWNNFSHPSMPPPGIIAASASIARFNSLFE